MLGLRCFAVPALREGGGGETVMKEEGRGANEGREEVLAENLVLLERRWVFGAWARIQCAGGVGGGAYGVGFWRSRGVPAVKAVCFSLVASQRHGYL